MLASYAAPIRTAPHALAFGFLLAFLSSFDQTYFVALSGEGVRLAFGISDGTLGTYYAAATLISGLGLPWVGAWIHRVALARFTILTGILLFLGYLSMALAPAAWALPPAFFLLRVAGQGLCSHVALTGTARRLERERGRALSLVSLGFASGEALLPPVSLGLLALSGWRSLWWLACTLLVAGTLAALGLLRRDPELGEVPLPSATQARGPLMLRDRRVWLVLPAVLAPPFVVTGFWTWFLSPGQRPTSSRSHRRHAPRA